MHRRKVQQGLRAKATLFAGRARPIIQVVQAIVQLSSPTYKMYAQSQLAYAPTPYSYTPSSSFTATINLDQVRHDHSHITTTG